MPMNPNDLVRILMADRHMTRREAMKHIAGVMGDREHDAAVQASFAAIAG